VRIGYRDYRKYKKAIWRRIREHDPDAVIVRWFRRRDVERCMEYGLLDPPELPSNLWDELRSIPRASGSPTSAAAVLDDGRVEQCVIFIESSEVTRWSLFDVPSQMLLRAVRLRRIIQSPKKLPISIEEKMNGHGETHMGGMVVNFILRDGTKFGHAQGSASSSFVRTPQGYVPGDIVDVEFGDEPGVVQVVPSLEGPDWKYCAFRAPKYREVDQAPPSNTQSGLESPI